MKKVFAFSFAAFLSLTCLAQNVADGFYRVQNYGSKRYAYVYDCTGGVNITTTSADMGAIVLKRTPEVRFTDPASVIYISNKGKSGSYQLYDLETQGTGVYKILSYLVSVLPGSAQGTYWVYEPTYNMYLWDGIMSKSIDESYVRKEPVSDNNNRCWSIFPVNPSTDEYLGIQPSPALKLGDKYYKPYYVGFAMNFASSGMKGYYISDVKNDAVIIKEIVGTVPAQTPVIVECSSAQATNNRVNLQYSTVAAIKGNKLSGNYFCYGNHADTDHIAYDSKTMRVLAVKDGKLQYVTDDAHVYTTPIEIATGDGDTETVYCLNANESYLKVTPDAPATLPVMTQEEYDATHSTSQVGDINNDGRVNNTDAALLYRYIASGMQAKDMPVADINKDGRINNTDAALLYRMIAAGK